MSTLAIHKKRPTTQLQVALKDVPAKFFAKQSKKIAAELSDKNLAEKAVPEDEAIWFYLSNAAMARIGQKFSDHEPLGECEEFADLYYRRLNLSSLRMFYYLLWICTRETRHCSTGGYPSIINEYGNEKGVDYLKCIKGKDSKAAVEYFKNNPPDMTIGEYTRHLEIAFFKGSYAGGYGGKAWGNVAKCLNSYVQGETTAEMMMDTAFTLAHNNGPIFNKGMLFSLYNGKEIIRILDAQRAGMMPQLVDSGASVFVKNDHKVFQQRVNKVLGDFGGPIDWVVVKKLGAVGHYGEAKTPKSAAPTPKAANYYGNDTIMTGKKFTAYVGASGEAQQVEIIKKVRA